VQQSSATTPVWYMRHHEDDQLASRRKGATKLPRKSVSITVETDADAPTKSRGSSAVVDTTGPSELDDTGYA
jgi:hypothetical protein